MEKLNIKLTKKATLKSHFSNTIENASKKYTKISNNNNEKLNNAFKGNFLSGLGPVSQTKKLLEIKIKAFFK